jgi:hypothetical protein
MVRLSPYLRIRIDIWPLCLFHDGASTLNAAIRLRNLMIRIFRQLVAVVALFGFMACGASPTPSAPSLASNSSVPTS